MRSISLTSAVLISINIIIGAGLFINPAPLAQIAQSYGFLAYPLSALVLLPLILCLAELATLKPSAGGLYVYAQTFVSPLAGFTSAWGYFLGKSTSAAILAFTFCSFITRIVPVLENTSVKGLTIFILFLLATLNIFGVKIGGKIQWLFISFKAIPICFVLLTGLFFALDIPEDSLATLGALSQSLPIAVFALTGFEAICSIAHLIENPHKNVRRAMLISFFLVAIVSAGFQFAMFEVLGLELQSTRNPLLAYASTLLPNAPLVARLFNALVYSSILGASFSMLTSNCWNLHTIATHHHLPGSANLIRLSKSQVPWVCLYIEALIGSIIIILQTDQIPLQNMAVFGMTMAYFMSTLAALRAAKDRHITALPRWLPALSLVSCAYILWLCAERILRSGASWVFLVILGIGLGLAYLRAGKKSR